MYGACFVSSKTRKVLGLDEIDHLVAGMCQTPFGREQLRGDLLGEVSAEQFAARQEQAEQARSWAGLEVRPDFAGVVDVREVLDLVAKDGTLTALDVVQIGKAIDAMGRIKAYVESRRDELAALVQIAQGLLDDRPFAARIATSFDDEGYITDQASPELLARRNRVRTLRKEAQGILDDQVRAFADEGVLQEKNFTVRHDRYVLPVKAEFQRKVEGIVHDASQTGQTVFIEPRAMLEVGNRITVAQALVKEEEHRILVEYTQEVRARREMLLGALGVTGALEALYVRGRFAHATAAVRPRVDDQAALHLPGARHPQLLYTRRVEPGSVVPQDIDLGGKQALVISGPNAGGKTVALKATGIGAVLARQGLLLPAGEDATVPPYAAVLAAVGDEQDLSQDLSTFSGHLAALSDIVDQTRTHIARGPVLVLLDELCAGTAPEQGAALAQSILETLVDLGATVVATTHYERLKTLAVAEETSPRFRNAKVGTDPETGRPTFTLIMDSMGASNAFDAARRHGLPDDIIARAEALMDPTGQQMQGLLEQLHTLVDKAEREQQEAARERARLREKRLALTERIDALHQEQTALRKGEAREVLKDLDRARKAIAAAIEQARTADAKTLNELSHELKDKEQDLQDIERGDDEAALGEPLTAVQRGQKVVAASMPQVVLEVLQIDGDNITLGKGALTMKVSLSQLRKPVGPQRGRAEPPTRRAAKKRAPKKRGPKKKVESAGPAKESPRNKDNTLDVRGHRVGEALSKVEGFLDKMVVEREARAYIIHGHGTGALKKAVRQLLTESHYVDAHDAAPAEAGGDGCTVVQLFNPRG